MKVKKYSVYGIMTASVLIGEYEAENALEAEAKCNDDEEAEWMPSICYQCSRKIDLGEIYKTEVVENDE